MRVFVAAESLEEEGDFSFTVPGELVHFPPVICDCPECGCERAMAGFTSHKATTCFVARDLDIDITTFVNLLFDTLDEGGWVNRDSPADRAWVRAWVRAWADEHVEAAAGLPVETPLRFRDYEVTVRHAGKAA